MGSFRGGFLFSFTTHVVLVFDSVGTWDRRCCSFIQPLGRSPGWSWHIPVCPATPGEWQGSSALQLSAILQGRLEENGDFLGD